VVPGYKAVSAYRQAQRLMPEGLGYALLLFAATRAALMLIGLISHDAFHGRDLSEFPHWFDMWNVWDSNWYIDIARNGYSTATNSVNMANYAFFPLYPMAMRLVAALIGDYFAAGLIVSNLCLIIACVYLYRLVSLDEDGQTARRSIKYLILFPTAFIFSGVFTESTFLALSLACLYYAKRGRWLYSGSMGFLTALTRPYGVIIALPMAYEYLRQRRIGPDALLLSLPLAGLSLFCLYNYFLTGDPLAFMHIQSAWGGRFSNPITELLGRLASGNGDVRFEALFTLASLALLVASFKKVDISYLAYGLLLILIPLSTPNSAWSMARYILVAFPIFIILAKLGENRDLDHAMTIVLAMLQGLLMALWTVWSYYII
jgi:hypothetical protein